VELREAGVDGGYPVFAVVLLHKPARGGPKNLIFASPEKPDLRFRDALDNDIEIVTNADKVLVYDRPIGSNGLLWSDLQRWWSETKGISDAKQAKATLYNRLKNSLPQEDSPPQSLLFRSYFEGFGGAIPQLPALLPEVWLHWDPKTVQARGKDALLRFRMDFLLLLPHGVRVVIEVDGKHHYADSNGVADVQRYAQTMVADRELKLAGYEVFRFGAAELQASTAAAKDTAAANVKTFFLALFKRYGIQTALTLCDKNQ
jgi:very-short-patch-repair endonuclease